MRLALRPASRPAEPAHDSPRSWRREVKAHHGRDRRVRHGLAGQRFVRVGGSGSGAASGPDVPISHRDRVYAAEQFSNTVSVTDPADNKVLGRHPAGRSDARET